MLKRIHERVQSKLADAEVVRDAEASSAAAGRMPKLFPPGSLDGHSEALPAVWQSWPGVRCFGAGVGRGIGQAGLCRSIGPDRGNDRASQIRDPRA
jgi:hypothetical protein